MFLLRASKFVILALIFFSVALVHAVNMESDRYKIQFGNVNIGARNQSSSNYNLSTTLGQTAANEFSSQGYTVKAGFQYIHSIIPFSFSLSQISIDFGSLVSSIPKTSQTVLTVSFGGAGAYQVTAAENGQLRTLLNNSIPDTSCDSGSSCNESLAQPWTLSSTYGFGYNMAGNDIPTDFVDSTYYRPFPDLTQSESPAVVMSSTNVGKNRQSTMTFKVNVGPVQPAGSYQTIVNIVATPSF